MRLSTTRTRIVIADDHEYFREGLKQVLSWYAKDAIEVVADSKNGQQLLDNVACYQPDLILTDIRMPQMDGIEASREICQQFPKTEVIAMSSFEDSSLIYAMLKAGAKGYLLKTSPPSEVVEAISSVRNGQPYYCSVASQSLIRMLASGELRNDANLGPHPFNANEVTIITYICQQLTTKEIADKMNLSVKSIENYSRAIKEKTNAKNLVGIAMFAIKNGIIKSEDV